MEKKISAAMVVEYDRLTKEALSLVAQLETLASECPLACRHCGELVLIEAEMDIKDEVKEEVKEEILGGSCRRRPLRPKRVPGLVEHEVLLF